MPSPFKDTAASDTQDLLTTAGGECFSFNKNIPGQTWLTSAQISDNLTAFPCFNKPPIINNPGKDIPWNPPPPVTTGCYPLRARAQTRMDENQPEGITAEFVENPTPDKCFPILMLPSKWLKTGKLKFSLGAAVAPSPLYPCTL